MQSPLPHVFPQPPFPLKREPTASALRGDTLGSRIDVDISLLIPLRLRGGFATECHAFSYYPSSSALATVVALQLQFRLRIGTFRV